VFLCGMVYHRLLISFLISVGGSEKNHLRTRVKSLTTGASQIIDSSRFAMKSKSSFFLMASRRFFAAALVVVVRLREAAVLGRPLFGLFSTGRSDDGAVGWRVGAMYTYGEGDWEYFPIRKSRTSSSIALSADAEEFPLGEAEGNSAAPVGRSPTAFPIVGCGRFPVVRKSKSGMSYTSIIGFILLWKWW